MTSPGLGSFSRVADTVRCKCLNRPKAGGGGSHAMIEDHHGMCAVMRKN